MRFGLNVPIFGEYADVRLLADLAVEAEAAGWDGFFVWDHVQWSGEDDGEPRQPSIDPIVALSVIAACTTRVRIGPMVMPLARRRPWKVARELTTLDHLSGGRVTLGVGLGGPPGLEFGDFGEETDAAVRAAKLDDGLDVLAKLWTGQPVDHDGPHYRLTRAELLPVPVQDHIPIWVGGEWPRKPAFRRAARYDGVHPLLDSVPKQDQPAAVAEMIDYIARHRTRTDPFDVVIGDYAGTQNDRDRVAAFAEAGATWWIAAVDHRAGTLAELRAQINEGPPAP